MSKEEANKRKSLPQCKTSPYFTEHTPKESIVHDLSVKGKDCAKITIRPYYKIKERPLETVLYPEFKFPDTPLPKPLATRKFPSESRRGGLEYEAEYYNITPEKIDQMAQAKKIKKILMIHGAAHSVSLFLNHKDDAQLAVYCDPLFTMKGEKEYVLRYTDKYKYPLAVLTMTSPSLEDLLRSRGLPKAMGEKKSVRWCTREFKQEPSLRFKKAHNLGDTIDLKGIHYHQSAAREARQEGEEEVKDDLYCFKKVEENGKEKLVPKQEGFIYQSQSPDYRKEEIDNYKTMVKAEIPLNPNARLLDRHGCRFCPYAGAKYYEYIKEHRPADYEFCKDVMRWGSASRIDKYDFLEKNLPRFKTTITQDDMGQIIDQFQHDMDWKNRDNPFRQQILDAVDPIINAKVKEIEQRTGKPITKKSKVQAVKDAMLEYPTTKEGHQRVYEYLTKKFEGFKKNSDRGLYILFPKNPNLL